MYYNKPDPLNFDDFKANSSYTGRELEQFADDLLKKDANRELCRVCQEKLKRQDKWYGIKNDDLPYGEGTGHVEPKAQYDDEGTPVTDEQGNQLYLDFPEYECKKGHRWYKGEGVRRDWKGPNPVLMEEHLRNRQSREILPMSDEAMGKPDPSIVSGLYHRTHPEGRKTNSQDQRRRNGASFYRAVGLIPLFTIPHWLVILGILSIGLMIWLQHVLHSNGATMPNICVNTTIIDQKNVRKSVSEIERTPCANCHFYTHNTWVDEWLKEEIAY